MTDHHHETSDGRAAVVAKLTDTLLVISCKDDLQWITQKRVGGSGKWPWRAKGYFLARLALKRVTAGLGAPTGKLEALPRLTDPMPRRTNPPSRPPILEGYPS